MSSSDFIGKRTAKGLVIRELSHGQAIGQWFVRLAADDAIAGAPLRMPFGGGAFEPCMTEGEAERVLFFARRGLGGLV